MSLIAVIVFLILIGVGLWLINTQIPMDQKIKTIINVLVVVVVILWLLNLFGLFAGGPVVPRVR